MKAFAAAVTAAMVGVAIAGEASGDHHHGHDDHHDDDHHHHHHHDMPDVPPPVMAHHAADPHKAAEAGPAGATVPTRVVTAYVTYCPNPTTFVHNQETYSVSMPGSVTVTNCPEHGCVIVEPTGSVCPDAGDGIDCGVEHVDGSSSTAEEEVRETSPATHEESSPSDHHHDDGPGSAGPFPTLDAHHANQTTASPGSSVPHPADNDTMPTAGAAAAAPGGVATMALAILAAFGMLA